MMSPSMKTLGDVIDGQSIDVDNTLPEPHYAFRERYRFPQMFSTPEAGHNVPRPFAKNQGPQGQGFYAANYHGGPRHTPTQVKFVSGLQKISGLSGLGLMLGDNGDNGDAATPPATTISIGTFSPWAKWLAGAVVATSTAASAYHGYKRGGDSWGGAFGWGLLGFIFPIITPAVALAMGYGKRRR